MALGYAYDTVCANLTLTYAGEEAHETHCKTDTEKERSLGGEIRLEDNLPEQECHEAVKTLGCRKS